MKDETPEIWDTIVVGAGPAGLTAALYLARYRRRTLILHDNSSRAMRIPKTHNAPSWPDGGSGEQLIGRMIDHATQYGATILEAQVREGATTADGFSLRDAHGGLWHSRTLIAATGLRDNPIAVDEATHDALIKAGLLRYCPVCDAFEHIDQAIGIVGTDEAAAAEALFLRRYSRHITILTETRLSLSNSVRGQLAAANIVIMEEPIVAYQIMGPHLWAQLAGSSAQKFDVIYAALGCRPRTEIVEMLGLEPLPSGALPPNTPLKTPIPGLYSAGDMVEGLDQINTAIAQGAIAATRAHNWLRSCDGETLFV